MSLNLPRIRAALQNFDYPSLFIEELGWNKPSSRRPLPLKGGYALEELAQLGGAKVFRVKSPTGEMPDRDTRKALSKEATTLALEHVLIFDSQSYQLLETDDVLVASAPWLQIQQPTSFCRTTYHTRGTVSTTLLTQ